MIGLALGFGAQTVVRDMLSGVFYLAEDAFRLGEYVEVGNIRGTVESIAIRSLKLRHHRGAVHTLPFGQITRLTNYSRDWVIQKLVFSPPVRHRSHGRQKRSSSGSARTCCRTPTLENTLSSRSNCRASGR